MSKMDNLRAMREARYDAAQKAAKKPGGNTATTNRSAPVAPKQAAVPPVAKQTPAGAEAATEALCGHRSMNGRTCTREQGHSAKNHRYN